MHPFEPHDGLIGRPADQRAVGRSRPHSLVTAATVLVGAVVALAGCSAGAGVRVEGAWIRVTTPDRPAAGYLTIVNDGDQPDALVGASSPAFAEVELHETVAMVSPAASATASPAGMASGTASEMASGMTPPSSAGTEGMGHGGAMASLMPGSSGGMASGGGMTPAAPSGSAGMPMGMRPVAEIPVPAHGRQTLQPGGYHLMLMNPTGPVTVGSTIQLTLRFRLAGEVTVTAEVRGA
jgi:copper(I)-binding protein